VSKPILILFGAIDLLGAVWMGLALRSQGKTMYYPFCLQGIVHLAVAGPSLPGKDGTMTAKSDLGTLPHWDLSNVYPSLESKDFTEAVDQLKAQLDELDSYMSERSIHRAGPRPEDSAELAETIGWVRG